MCRELTGENSDLRAVEEFLIGIVKEDQVVLARRWNEVQQRVDALGSQLFRERYYHVSTYIFACLVVVTLQADTEC